MELDLLNVFAVLLAAWLAGWLASRLGFPAVLGELAAGVVLGPPILGLLHGTEALSVLAQLGVLLMMLYIGMEINPRELTRVSWTGVLAAVGGFFTPFALAYGAVLALGGSHIVGLLVGVSAGVTSLAVSSRMLLDLRILDTRIAHMMTAGALVADILSLLVFSMVLGIVEIGTIDALAMLAVLAKAALFFAVTVLIGSRLFPYVGRLLTDAGLTGRTFNFTLVLIIAVFFGELAEIAGLHAILGAFIAGLFLRENVLGQTLSRDLRNAVQDTSIGLLTPIFFVTAGFRVSFGVFQEELTLFLIIFFAAIVGKILGTALFYLPSKNGWRESLVIGAGMNGRGGVDIVLIGIALELGIIQQDIFSILVFMALLTTATVPLTLKAGVTWLKRRGELVRSGTERNGVLIVGAGPLARRLAAALGGARPVTLVDNSESHCKDSEAEGLTAVLGNALQEQVLSEAQADRAELLIAMTPNAEVNAIVTRTARDVFQVPDVYLVHGGEDLRDQKSVRKHLQADALFARATDTDEWDYLISHGNAIQSEVLIEQDEDAQEFATRLDQERSSVALAVWRDDMIIPVHEQIRFSKGDRVIVLRARNRRQVKQDRFDRIVSICPVLDLKDVSSADEFFARTSEVLAGRVSMDREMLTEAFKKGETWSSTVIAPGLAIPHVLIPDDQPFQLLIARSVKGIRFPDQEGVVHTIFVLLGNRADRNFHLRTLSAIAQIAQDESFEKKWMMALGPEELRDLILRAERRRFPDAINDES